MQINGQSIRQNPGKLALLALPLLAAVLWFAWEGISDIYVNLIVWINQEQRLFHKSLTKSISAYADNSGFATAIAIITGSFLYGVFHAAGPGHGKVILSTYLLSQPEKIGKSVVLAVISSLVQGLVAIALVYGLFYIFGVVSADMKLAVSWSERLAFALVVAIGLMLVWRGMRGFGWFQNKAKHTTGHHHDHAHSHDHSDGHSHNHSHDDHGVCNTCGHAHIPSVEQVNSVNDWRTLAGVVLSIGMRPCSGAILVLVFSRFSGIPWAGAFAVLAMSAGTAITVATLAVLSVQARSFAMRVMVSNGSLASFAANGATIACGLLLASIGIGLMTTSFAPPIRSMGL